MKQIIYRRKSASSSGLGGFEVTAKADSITPAQRTAVEKHASVPLMTDASNYVSFYKQFKQDEDTLVVTCGFGDPWGERGSAITFAAMTENRGELFEYLSRFPAASDYFEKIKDEYSDSKDSLELEKGNMMVSLDEYFASATVRREDAPSIIRNELGSEDMVFQMLSALLDVSGKNPRMIVVFMNAEDMGAVSVRGRRLAEALLSCLPKSAAAAVGFMSPAVDDEHNATFGIRFALRENFKLKNTINAYVFDLTEGKVTKPKSAETGAEAYVRKLTSLIMQGGETATARIDELCAVMEDPSCFRVKSKDKAAKPLSVPSEMDIRYALITRPERMEPPEMHRMLDWRHSMIDEALAKDSEGFTGMAFWRRVDDWTLNVCLPELWRSQGAWKKGGGAYDPASVLRVFEDSQRLYTADYDMSGYRDFVAQKLTEGRLYTPDEAKLRGNLMKYFKKCVEEAARDRMPSPLQSKLYFEPVENWMRTVWLAMRPTPSSRDMLAPVAQLYGLGVLDSDKAQVYVDAYSELIFEGRKGLFMDRETRFYSAVVQTVVRNRPDKLAESMDEDLRGKNPYASAGNMQVWQWYRRLATQMPELEDKFLVMNRGNLEKSLAGKTTADVPALVDELRGVGLGVIVCAGKLDPHLNAQEMIEKRIAALSKSSGIGEYYPDRIELAGKVAELLDKHEGTGWGSRHRALTDVCNMHPNRLTMADFDRFAEIVASGTDSVIADRARELLKAKLAQLEAGSASMESMLIGLNMLTLSTGWGGDERFFNPAQAAAYMKELGLRENKLEAWCKKHADSGVADGVGYLAEEMYACLRLSEKKRSDASFVYPREVVVRGRRRPLEGLPVAVPIVGVVVFGCGLAASTLGLLSCIGLL